LRPIAKQHHAGADCDDEHGGDEKDRKITAHAMNAYLASDTGNSQRRVELNRADHMEALEQKRGEDSL
jgi:hypothetical protein